MPAGLSWPRYIMFCTTALITMLTGAQYVHEIYRPLDDLEDLVERELKERRKKLQEK
ncbi:ubiquinol-cytochrome c reductase complex assembly factor 6 [Anoplolepis gracilipes]|uniref:ubiquinol-cytochrome c reductase complex assembly factor 6 n=1 Tax=Anoplolepis gracilipes TaxID=354296 RepID=UPI003BA021DE